MNHNEYREKLPLLVYGELAKEEQKLVKAHIEECAACSEEMEQLEKIQTTFESAALPKTSEQLLTEARMELRAALRLERSRKTWKDIWTERIQGWMPSLRISFAALASLAFGIFIGYKAIRPTAVQPDVSKKNVPAEILATTLNGSMQITDVKFQDADASDGHVEFTFEASQPMTYKGSINNPDAQRVLTYALVNAQNPGIRLHAVNALGSKPLRKPDDAIKKALIEALMKDENPGVRMEALTALQKFEMDQEIKEAILHVLVKDQNAGMRIIAIKSIEAERLMDQQVVNVLREVQTDPEEYVRLKAKTLIQEVSQKQ